MSETELARLGMSLDQISRAIGRTFLDVPAGRFADGAFTVRSLGLRRSVREYAGIEVMIRPDGSRVTLGDIAVITETNDEPGDDLTRNCMPADELKFYRGKTSDTLEVSRVIQDWLAEYRIRAPESLVIEQYDVRANLIQERISLLVRNGLGGLVLVVGVLFLFLSGRVAFWVATGIPVAFMATFGVMLASGQSINMISLFGLIMALGIVVDDAIVIGEHAEHLRQRGAFPLITRCCCCDTDGAACGGAMLTTVAAFLPLFTVKGIIGEISQPSPWWWWQC